MRLLKSECRKVKRLLEKEKVSFRNRKLKMRKTGITKEFCPGQVYIEMRLTQSYLRNFYYRGPQILEKREVNWRFSEAAYWAHADCRWGGEIKTVGQNQSLHAGCREPADRGQPLAGGQEAGRFPCSILPPLGTFPSCCLSSAPSVFCSVSCPCPLLSCFPVFSFPSQDPK